MIATAATDRIGDYVLDVELGRGAFGVVYRAHHINQPDSPVALKVIEGHGDLDRSMLEPALLAQLDHPCIVGIEDYFRDGGRLVLALEFVEGEDLKTLLDRGETFSQAQIRDMLVQMAGALAAAHERQIVHRDIKPSNILVMREAGRLRFVLTDFGVGRREEGIQDRKRTGGTYLFMAPEQLRGRPGLQSDLWALGVVAYRMLTGQLPFPGPSLPELIRQIQYATPAPTSQLCAEPVDPVLETAILRMLDKSLQERVTSAEELLRLLEFHGRPDEVLSRLTTVPRHGTKVAETLDRRLTRSIRRGKIWLILFLAAYLLPYGLISTALLLGGIWLFFKAQSEDAWTRRRRNGVILAAIAILAVRPVLQYGFGFNEMSLMALYLVRSERVRFAGESLGTIVMVLIAVIAAVVGILQILSIILPPIAASVYVGMRRRQREKVLRDAALHSGTRSEEFLSLLRRSLDYRFADVGFHLKYAEALVARGRHADAAVEARLMLVQDPYNFAGNLLLANCYYSLGLHEDAVAICDDYLKVSGYCFEFAELRDQCRSRMGSP